MCGLLGLISLKSTKVNVSAFREAGELLSHRGPDGSGEYFDENISFIHKRLALRDLSSGSAQPFIDNGDVLIFNGQIYNYKLIQQSLVKKGIHFNTTGDTEVLIKALKFYDEKVFSEIDAEYAFAYWNKNKSHLTVARDFSGVKPLYYKITEDYLIFSSEIKPILKYSGNCEINNYAIQKFFAFRYCPGEETMFKGIFKLLPGYSLSVDSNKKIVFSQNFRKAAESTDGNFYEELKKSTELRFSADTKVGLLLSGGIDSSILGTFADEGTNCFTYNMPHSPDFKQASSFAKEHSLKHHVVEDEKFSMQRLKEAVYALEEPLADSIIEPTYKLLGETRKHVKAVLSGEGADELFGGYVHQQVALKIDFVPRSLRRALTFISELLPNPVLDYLIPYPQKLTTDAKKRIKLVSQSIDNPAQVHQILTNLWNEQERKQLILSGDADVVTEFYKKHWPSHLSNSYFDQFVNFEQNYWLPDYNLLRMDKLGMAHGLEVRVPYLMNDLVTKVNRLLRSVGYHNKKNKNLLRNEIRWHKPLSLIERKKFPFFKPFHAKEAVDFRNQALLLLGKQSLEKYGILNSEYVENFLKNPESSFIYQKKLVSLVVFQLWCENYFRFTKKNLHESI